MLSTVNDDVINIHGLDQIPIGSNDGCCDYLSSCGYDTMAVDCGDYNVYHTWNCDYLSLHIPLLVVMVTTHAVVDYLSRLFKWTVDQSCMSVLSGKGNKEGKENIFTEHSSTLLGVTQFQTDGLHETSTEYVQLQLHQLNKFSTNRHFEGFDQLVDPERIQVNLLTVF
eukprot:Em0001g591a